MDRSPTTQARNPNVFIFLYTIIILFPTTEHSATSWKKLLCETRALLFLCCLSFTLWLPMLSDRQGERQWVTKLAHLSSRCKCSLTMNAAVPYRRTVLQWGLVFQNPSLASLLLPRAHSRQPGTQEQEDEEEVKKEGRGTVKLPMEGHTPNWKQCSSSMIPLYPPPTSLWAVTLHRVALHQLYCCCCCCCCVRVCQQISIAVCY